MNKKKIIGVSVGSLLVILGIAIVVICLTVNNDPKTKVIRAVARLFPEETGRMLYDKNDRGRGILLSEYYRSNKAYRKNAEKALGGRFSYDASLMLKGLDADVPGLSEILSYISGIKLKNYGSVDLENERIRMTTGLSYAIVSLPRLTLDVSGSEVALSSDEFFEGALCVDTEGMGTAYDSSELSDIVGLKLGSERAAALDNGLFADKEEDKDPKSGEKIKAFIRFYDSVEVEEAEEKRDIFIDGKVMSCDVYTIKASAGDISDLISELSGEDIMIKNDCTMEAALTPKGNLAYLGGEYADCVFDLEIRSESCARNDMNLMFGKTGVGSVEIACSGEENGEIRNDRISLEASVFGRSINLETAFESTMSPSGVSVDITDIDLDTAGFGAELSGDIDIMFDEPVIGDVPGPKREILKMSEADFDRLGVEIYDNLMKNDLIAMALSMFGGEGVVGDIIDLMNSGR